MERQMSFSVDRDFARFGSKTYAINKINSVDIRARRPHSRGAALGWAFLALVFLLASLGQFQDASGSSGGTITLLLSVLFAFLTYRAWQRSKIVEYQLFLMTSSSEAQAIVSQDCEMIHELRERIEQAMAGRLP